MKNEGNKPEIQVIGVIFSRRGQDGDFDWMIRQPDYDDALFIFNDNEEQFLAHQKDPNSASGCAAGSGNAVIRPWQCKSPPRAAGVPTGSHGAGYSSLTPPVKTIIDQAIEVIRDLLATGRYQRVFYSASSACDSLGTGIFQVGDDVKDYIVDQLKKLPGSTKTRHSC